MSASIRFTKFLALCLVTLLLSGCAETNFVSHYAKKLPWPGEAQNQGTYKVGNPYKVGSVWYYPQENFRLVETGIASWYGPDFHGKHTANGEVYDQNELTAAHRTLQMPSLVRVTNLENGRSIIVRVNDRGPYLHGRVIDVSKRAAELLGFIGKGTARVKLEVQEKSSRQIAEAARRGMNTSRLTMADLDKMDTNRPAVLQNAAYVTPVVTRGAQVASRDSDNDALPESLQTPTITVEQLAAPGSRDTVTPDAPTWKGDADVYSPPPVVSSRPIAPPSEAAVPTGHMNDGRYMPDAVVATVPVTPTGIFVQAGSFAVYDNAQRLSEKLKKIAPVVVDPVTVNGRKLYRVRLGPISSVAKADAVLEKVINAGNGTARVVHQQ